MGKRTAQKDAIKDTTSDSQVNSYFPFRWSPASLTFNIYFYLFLYLYITEITLNNGTSHLKSPKNQNRSRTGTASNKTTGGGGSTSLWPTTPRPSSAPAPRHPAVRSAWKIPSSQMQYLRNIEIRIITKIKQTRGPTGNSNTETPEQKKPTS